MPWSSLPILGSMSGINTTLGKISLVLFVIPLFVSLIGNKANELNKGLLYSAIIPGMFAGIIALLQIIILKTSKSHSNDPFEALVAANLSIGFGLYIAILTGISMPLFAFLIKDSKTVTPKEITKMPVHNTWKDDIKDTQTIIKEETIILETKENTIDKEDHSRFMPK